MTQFMVYLSGPITGLTYRASSDWRELATRSFPPHIQGLSPLRGKRFLNTGKEIVARAYEFPLSTDRAVNARNHFDILRSQAMLVNLLGAERASLETAMEIAWAHDHQIPIVVAMEPEGNVHDHPMIRDCITVRVSSLDEAIEAVTAIVSPADKFIWNRIDQNRMLQEENRLHLGLEPLPENMVG